MKRIFFILTFLWSQQVCGQFLMELIDTTTEMGKGLFALYKKFDRVRIGGYIQPQFQWAQEKGTKSYNGGDFAPAVNNRFMLRRGRIRFEYAHFNDSIRPSVQFVFQFDGTERGVFIRDFWGRVYENRWQVTSFAMGMFARPFGYELNLGSSDRESPERGRMSQILMKTERDLGAMASFEPRKKRHSLWFLKADLGFFNGQGLSGANEFDSYKDIISRISIKPFPVSGGALLSFGLSHLNGGLIQNSRYIYTAGKSNGIKIFSVDSSVSNIGKKAPRKYYGADVQIKIKNKLGVTELRGEFWWGTQTATSSTSETPGIFINEPYYTRKFNGAFFYFLHNIINTRHQIGVKYDWYDPNIYAEGIEIGKPGSDVNATDIKYGTLTFGYNYYLNENLKVMIWYDVIRNEKTSLPGFTSDVRDNIFTFRMQFRF